MIHQPSGRFTPPMIQRFRCDAPILAQDRIDLRSAASAFRKAKKLVKNYGSRLRLVARHIDQIIRHYDPTTAEGQSLMQAGLIRYRDTLGPFAEATAEKMVAEVVAANEKDWRRLSAKIGRGVEKAIASAPIAPVMAQMQANSVRLIKSLPEGASERVARCAVEGIAKGQRPDVIAAEIMRTGAVSRSRADMIARTETGRASTALTMARAQHVGSTHFRWMTAGDYDVRPSHRKLNGLTFRWDDPPECDPGHHALPGAIFNCRCWPSPIIDL